jgi:hypothetical protein
MPFQTVPITVAGPSYQDRSRPLSSQTTRNFYQEVVPSGKNQFVLKSFPGQSLFGSAPDGTDRGATQMAEVEYRVVGQTLYEVASTGVHTAKGTIGGSDRCIFSNDGVNLFIVAGTTVYQYDGATVTIVTDVNIAGSKSVTFINNQFIYTKDTLSTVSDVGDGASASGLNSIGAESSPDDLVRDYVFDQVIYRCGLRTIEAWYNPGVGSPPIARLDGREIAVGLGAIHAITNTKDGMYWLGNDRRIYRTRGGVEEQVSSAAISNATEGYSDVSDSFMDSFVLQGRTFIVISFPSENKTWCLIEELGTDGWFELSADLLGGRYNINSFVTVYGEVLLGHETNGNLYKLDIDDFTLGGETMQRRRVMASISGENINQRGKRLQMSRFELIMEMGTGLITGQGENPLIMIEASYDGGKSWTTGTWMRVGRLGETNIRAEWFNLTSFYDLIIRITTTDPVDYSIYSGAIDLRLAGR